MPLKSTEAQKEKLSDFRGKYVLLEVINRISGPPDIGMTDTYKAYGQDGRLVMLRVVPKIWIIPPNDPMPKQPDVPWKLAMVNDEGDAMESVVQENFALQGSAAVWLIGPDGKVVAKDLQGDGIKAAVMAALGAARPTTGR